MAENDTTTGIRSLPTVEIIRPNNPHKIIRINESDFDPEKGHILASAKSRKMTPDEMIRMDAINERYKALQATLPPPPADHRNDQIEQLRRELAEAVAKLGGANAPPAAAPKHAEHVKEEITPATDTGKRGPGRPKGTHAEPAGDALSGLKDL